MVNVLQVIWRWDGGGIEAFLNNLMKYMKTEEVHFDFVVFGPETTLEHFLTESGSKVFHLPEVKGHIGKLKLSMQIIRILQENKYDIVHSHLSGMNPYVMFAAIVCNVEVRISHVHNVGCEAKQSLKCKIQRIMMCAFATDRIACSRDARDYYFGEAEKNRVIYCGVDLDRFTDNGLAKDEKTFAIIGRYCPEKNPEFIKQLIINLHKLDETYKFVWCGGGYSELIKNIS